MDIKNTICVNQAFASAQRKAESYRHEFIMPEHLSLIHIYLMTQVIPDSNGESEETTTYTYTLDNRGIVTSCHAVVRHIRNGYAERK